jgi:uncharacterized membrane protein
MRYAVLVAALAAAAGSTHTLAQFSGFERIDTPGSALRSITPTDINSDGTVVVGFGYTFDFFGYRPIRRIGGEQLEELGLYPGETRARAYAVNANGAFIVGGGDAEGFWWVPPGPNIGSASPPLLDVNDDGSVFISETIRYAGLDSPADFPNIPSYTSLRAARLDASGNTAALSCNFFEPGNGYGYPPEPSINIDQAARWTPESGTQGIGFLPTGDSSFALGISADGAVIVGRANVQISPGVFRDRAFRWNAVGGMQLIPMLPGDPNGSATAVDASGDGSVIVGRSNDRAFIWDAVHGTRDLQTLIASNGHDLNGWTLFSADAISDDGLIVAGIGDDGSGFSEGWVANLGVTCTPPASIGSVTLDVVAREGGAATGTAQLFGSQFTPNDLKADGTVAFDASLAGGTQTCYTGVPTSLSLIAIANGSPYIQPSLLRVTASNQAALRDVRSYFPGPESKFLYYSGLVGSLSVLAESGTPAPQTGGGTFEPFPINSSDPFLNNSDLYAFQSQIVGGSTGVGAFANVGGLLTRSLVSLPSGFTSLANPKLTALTDTGALVRRGNLNDANGAEAILTGGPPPAASALVVRTGDPVPGESVGVTFTDLLDVAAQDHSVAFFATISSGSTVFCKGTSSSVQVIAKLGSIVDGLPARTIQSFVPSKGFALLPDGELIFVANLTDPVDASQIALVRSTPSGLQSLVLGATTKLPGYEVCRFVKDLQLVAADGDRALISATPTFASEQGMFLVSDGGLTKLAQVGQSVDLAPGVSGQISQIIPPGGFPAARTGRDGRGTYLSGNAAAFTATVSTAGGPKRALLRAAFSLPNSCPCDLNGDGFVDDTDFTLFIPAYNILDCADPTMPPGCPADFNADGVVEDTDFTIFVVAYNELICP